MKTAATTLILSTHGADYIAPGVNVVVRDLPTMLRWWLTTGSITRWATRRRA